MKTEDSVNPRPQLTEMTLLESWIERLREQSDSLEQAEAAANRIPQLLSRAESVAGQDGDDRGAAFGDEAQRIRNRLRDARLDLQETIRRLPSAVASEAIQSRTGRFVLDRLDGLSPYASVRTAKEARGLLQILLEGPATRASGADAGTQSPTTSQDSRAAISGLASLPLAHPSPEDRERLVALLEEAIDRSGDNFKSAAGAIKISENTLRTFRKGQPTSPTTWRKVREYVKRELSQ